MGRGMNAATVPQSRSAAPVGRLVAVLAAAAFLLAALTGNSFSLHVGMTDMAPAATTAADLSDTPAASAGVTSSARDATGHASADAATPMPIGSDAQHLMHLLGACLAVIAAAALLLLVSRVPGGGYLAVAAVPRLDAVPAQREWSPPALSPPTSSPVIRT